MGNPQGIGGFRDNPQNINVGGKPKREWTMTGMIEEELEKLIDEMKDGKTTGAREIARRLVAKRLVVMAINGNLGAIKELNNRTDGMAKQTIDITTPQAEGLSPEKIKQIDDNLKRQVVDNARSDQ